MRLGPTPRSTPDGRLERRGARTFVLLVVAEWQLIREARLPLTRHVFPAAEQDVVRFSRLDATGTV